MSFRDFLGLQSVQILPPKRWLMYFSINQTATQYKPQMEAAGRLTIQCPHGAEATRPWVFMGLSTLRVVV
jgi:hypothetical protein